MSEALRQESQQIRAGYFNPDAFKHKEKLILVLKTAVAGLCFHIDKGGEAGKAMLTKLKPGTELNLFRDVDNVHDKWAISVYTKNDEHLGYVTRPKNETIAGLMDTGRRFFAFVDEPHDRFDPTPDDSWHANTEDFDLPFSIYMSDV